MNILYPLHRQILTAFIEEGVRFVLIGGYAVVYHGYVRYTADMDIWLCPTLENKQAIIEALRKVGIEDIGIEYVQQLDFRDLVVFHMGVEPDKIDFLTQVKSLEFESAYSNAVYFSFGALKVPVLHLDDLVLNKMVSGRLKDQADVEELQKIAALRNKDKL